MKELVLIVHNIRSTHNVGSLLRTADGLGLQHVHLTGYTPYPTYNRDPRMPHEALKLARQIHKTALGAEDTQAWSHEAEITTVLEELRQQGFIIAALEQATGAIPLTKWSATSDKLAMIVGREVEGIEPEVLAGADVTLEIPMHGQKESFNVAIAAAMALFYLQFSNA